MRDIGVELFRRQLHAVQVTHHMDIALVQTKITQHIVACYGVSVSYVVVAAKNNVIFTQKTRKVLISLNIFAHTMRQHKQRLGLFGNIKIKMYVAKPCAAGEGSCNLFHNAPPCKECVKHLTARISLRIYAFFR